MIERMSAINVAIALVAYIPATSAFTPPHHRHSHASIKHHNQLSSAVVTSTSPPQTIVGKRIPINEAYPGLKRVHTSPDVFIITNFLDDASCKDMIDRAKEKGTSRSPVSDAITGDGRMSDLSYTLHFYLSTIFLYR